MNYFLSRKSINANLFNSLLVMLIFIGATSFPSSANAALPFKASPAELKLLPVYCQVRLGDNNELKAQWKERLKSLGGNLHHYCGALKFYNRANAEYRDKATKRFYLSRVIGELNYVLKKWKPTYPLYKDAVRRKEMAESMLRFMR